MVKRISTYLSVLFFTFSTTAFAEETNAFGEAAAKAGADFIKSLTKKEKIKLFSNVEYRSDMFLPPKKVGIYTFKTKASYNYKSTKLYLNIPTFKKDLKTGRALGKKYVEAVCDASSISKEIVSEVKERKKTKKKKIGPYQTMGKRINKTKYLDRKGLGSLSIDICTLSVKTKGAGRSDSILACASQFRKAYRKQVKTVFSKGEKGAACRRQMGFSIGKTAASNTKTDQDCSVNSKTFATDITIKADKFCENEKKITKILQEPIRNGLKLSSDLINSASAIGVGCQNAFEHTYAKKLLSEGCRISGNETESIRQAKTEFLTAGEALNLNEHKILESEGPTKKSKKKGSKKKAESVN